MQELQQHTGKLKIENYGLWEFLQDFQQGVSQGYELDDSNEGFPQVFGSLYTCLLKPKTESVKVLKPEGELKVYPGGSPDTPAMTSESEVLPVDEVIQETPAAKRGPKPKNN